MCFKCAGLPLWVREEGAVAFLYFYLLTRVVFRMNGEKPTFAPPLCILVVEMVPR